MENDSIYRQNNEKHKFISDFSDLHSVESVVKNLDLMVFKSDSQGVINFAEGRPEYQEHSCHHSQSNGEY